MSGVLLHNQVITDSENVPYNAKSIFNVFFTKKRQMFEETDMITLTRSFHNV